MKNMEREKFEESWRKSFEKAELSPSDTVWTNVELNLEKASGGDLKRRLMFYQMLAAASVVFAMAIGGVGYYYSFHAGEGSRNTIALQDGAGKETELSNPYSTKSEEEESPSGRTEEPGKADQPPLASNAEDAPLENRTAEILRPRPFDGRTEILEERIPQSTEQFHDLRRNESRLAFLPAGVDNKKLTPIYAPREVVVDFKRHQQTVDPVAAMMARLAAHEREMQDEEDARDKGVNTNENLWTSVGFAAGSFNALQGLAPASASGPATMTMAAAPIVDQEASATGYSYSMGVNIGTKLSRRWVLQGGVNYLTHASEYVANSVVMDGPSNYQQQKFRAVSTTELMASGAEEFSDKLVYSAPYNVNNNMRYLSVPLQAGYLLVDKTFGLQLNAGVATDLFLQNTISGDSDQLAKTSQSMGSDSPYRTVNLSGLVGTEFSYRFGDHYRLSLNPGLRYPLNTIYKSELGVQSTPLTFDVGLRFRYIFK